MKPFVRRYADALDPELKVQFGEGPWQAEPDFWSGHSHGFGIQILRQPFGGALGGYIRLPPGHPWHGRHYEDCIPIFVHRGVQYSASDPEGVGWVLGFVAAEENDYLPAYNLLDAFTGLMLDEGMRPPATFRDRQDKGAQVYRDIEYIRGELHYLAEQAARAAGAQPGA